MNKIGLEPRGMEIKARLLTKKKTNFISIRGNIKTVDSKHSC